MLSTRGAPLPRSLQATGTERLVSKHIKVRLPVFLTVLAACGSAGDDTTRVVVDTVGGIERITTRGNGAWREGDAWRVTSPRLRIGSADGAAEEVFGSVSGLAVAQNGRIYIADGQANEIRVFTPAGKPLTRFGRQGEGPGEFRAVDGIAIFPDGRIAVRDPRIFRLSMFHGDGRFLSSFPLMRPFMQPTRGEGLWVTRDARIVDRVTVTATLELSAPRTVSVIIYSADGVVQDTLSLIEVPPGGGIPITRNGMLAASMSIPFAPAPVVAVDPDGNVAYSDGAQYEIDVLRAGQSTVRRFARERALDVVTTEERDAARARLDARVRQLVEDGRLGAFEFPANKPAYTHLVADATGHWWAGHRSGSDFAEQPTSYDLYDPDGRFLGAVSVPPIRILQIGDDFIAGVARDDFDVETVVVLPLIKPKR